MKDFAVIGLGKSGISTIKFLLKKGYTLDIFDTRKGMQLPSSLPNNLIFKSGDITFEEIQNYKTLVVSPGIALSTPFLKEALENGIEIIGDIELFARYAKGKVVGITGSNGKSTVTTLVGLMAKADGKKCGVGGNIGIPALDVLNDDNEIYVLELSSFELETTKSLVLQGATILNLSEDHLDRYQSSMDLYLAAKQRIFINAKNIIVNRDDKKTYPNDKVYKGSFGLDSKEYGRIVLNGQRFLSYNGEPIINIDDMLIKGSHNEMNALAAIALADTVGISRKAQVEVLKTFIGLPHRCQLVRELNGVKYYNDSKATNVGSTLAAVFGLKESVKGKIILLAGGLGKGQNFAPIQEMLGKEIGIMYCFGKDGEMLSKLGPEAVLVKDMEEAIKMSYQVAKKGDIVLLAPACASLDQFKNFEERGELFAKMVLAL
ncbi:MAG: UDP-N-acetylmuramoyl-L-alanine--D-glutamate ligase [Succinivibrionaceae bacterium]